MTVQGTAPGARDVPGRPALSRLVGVDAHAVEAFATKAWGSEPWLATRTDRGDDFADLFGPDAVDELVSRRGLRTPFLRVAKDGATFGDGEFTAGGGIGAGIADQVSDDKLLHLFGEGSTMVLQGLHRTWPALIDFSQQLAADLGHPVQVNAYVTPGQSRGFADHYDVHDVFVLQVQGEKHWTIRPPVHPAPLRGEPWTDRRAAVQRAATAEAMLDVVLRPGDCLYLPRGYLHAATALGGVSTHLTIGVHTWTRQALAEQLVRAALATTAAQADVRASLGLGIDVGDPSALEQDVELVRSRLLEAVRGLSAQGVADGLLPLARENQRAAPVGPLAQLDAAEAVDADTRIVLRRHLMARREDRADGSVGLRSRAGWVEVPATQARGLDRVLQGGPVRVGDLLEEPEVAQSLARRLLRAGIVTPV